MRNSRRIKRMSRNRVKITKMNLTSLMDVFTILVFFLLVNSGSVEVVEAPKDVKLPESVVESKPRETAIARNTLFIRLLSVAPCEMFDRPTVMCGAGSERNFICSIAVRMLPG